MWKAYTVKNIKHYGKIKFYLKNCWKIYFMLSDSIKKKKWREKEEKLIIRGNLGMCK